MNGLEQLMQAAMTATPARRRDALRVLSGQALAVDADQPPPVVEPYLSLREVCHQLAVSRTTLWRWQVPSHDLGGQPKYRLSEVRAYLKSTAFKRRQAANRAQRRWRKSPHTLTPTVPGQAGVNSHPRPDVNPKP